MWRGAPRVKLPQHLEPSIARWAREHAFAQQCFARLRWDATALFLHNDDCVVVPLHCTRGATNVFGTMHGGMTMSVIDAAAQLCVVCNSNSCGTLVTTVLETQFTAAVREGVDFCVEAKPVSVNDTETVVRVAVSPADGTGCFAFGLCRVQRAG